MKNTMSNFPKPLKNISYSKFKSLGNWDLFRLIRAIRIIRIILIILFFFSFAKLNPIYSAGQRCCDRRFIYDPSNDHDPRPCKMYGEFHILVEERETACFSDEVCLDPGTRGLCTEAGANAGDNCCEDQYCLSHGGGCAIPKYDNERNGCYVTIRGSEIRTSNGNCSTEQWCSSTGRCVSGETGEETTPITLLKPKECDYKIIDTPGGSFAYKGIQTALGCFPIDPKNIIEWILKYAVMLAGGIGFLLMLFASFQIMTSAGDPEKLKAGQQLLSSAITGILLIVFSLFILKFIGADILKIPGWS